MKELLEKLQAIAQKEEGAGPSTNYSGCSACCWGGTCCSNPVSG